MSKLILLLILFLAASIILPSSVLANGEDMIMTDGVMVHEMHMGPMVWNKMLHAWISLVAAIIIFIVGLKYMTGGKLARPIMLIGFGSLADAVIGLFPSHQGHMENMWLGSLLFSISVVAGIIWMAKIFGVFQLNKSQ